MHSFHREERVERVDCAAWIAGVNDKRECPRGGPDGRDSKTKDNSRNTSIIHGCISSSIQDTNIILIIFSSINELAVRDNACKSSYRGITAVEQVTESDCCDIAPGIDGFTKIVGELILRRCGPVTTVNSTTKRQPYDYLG